MKFISLGMAKPDDPIYKTGLAVGGQRLTRSTPPSAPATAGAKPAKVPKKPSKK